MNHGHLLLLKLLHHFLHIGRVALSRVDPLRVLCHVALANALFPIVLIFDALCFHVVYVFAVLFFFFLPLQLVKANGVLNLSLNVFNFISGLHVVVMVTFLVQRYVEPVLLLVLSDAPSVHLFLVLQLLVESLLHLVLLLFHLLHFKNEFSLSIGVPNSLLN